MDKILPTTLLAFVGYFMVSAWELPAQGPCNDTDFSLTHCADSECAETTTPCGTDPTLDEVRYKQCLSLTGGICNGLDLECHCIPQNNLDCPIKGGCAAKGLSNTACTTFNSSGCGQISDAKKISCGGTGCAPL